MSERPNQQTTDAVVLEDNRNPIQMKSPKIQNIIVDEANEVTYVVMAPRLLTDGEVFSAIRVEILRRGRKRPGRGETLVISPANGDSPASAIPA